MKQRTQSKTKSRGSRDAPAPQGSRFENGAKDSKDSKDSKLHQALELYRFMGDLEGAGFSVDRLLDRFLSHAMKMFRTDAGTVFSATSQGNELVFRIVRGVAREKLKGQRLAFGEGIAGWAAQSRKPRLVRDVRRHRRWSKSIGKLVAYPARDIMAVPLLARSGKLVGVVELLNQREHPGFSRTDLHHLVAISAPMGNLLENARLLSETRKLNQQLGLLNQVSHLVASTLSPREVRRRTIDAATRLMDCEAGSLLLLDAKTQELFFEVALGEGGTEAKKVRLKPGEGIAGWVVTHGQPQLVNDCEKDPRWSRRVDRRTRFVTRNMVCVPVRMKDQVIGALQAINKRAGVFHQEDVELLSALADQVAVALENAHLFEELQRTLVETSEALAEAIDLRDPYTGGHTRRVTKYSLAIGRQMGLSEDELEQLRLSAILHDIGKIGVDDRVLRKPGRLEEEEYQQMKEHPRLGSDILKNIRYLMEVLPGIRSHHERRDGMGYPDALAENDVPLTARIIAVADTYDAMTSDRPYRQGLDKRVAVCEIRLCSGTQFDPDVVSAFLAAYRRGDITGSVEKVPAKPRGKPPMPR